MSIVTPAEQGDTQAVAHVPARRGAVHRLVRNPLGAVSAVALIMIVGAVIAAGVLAPQGATLADLSRAFGSPSSGHPFGFDSAGRDVLSRILWGGRNTLGGAALALVVAIALGVPSGLLAGYYGRWFDSAASWVVNLLMALPAMIVLLAARAVVGPTVWVLMVVLGVLVSPAFFRLVRGVVANVRNEPYVEAARVAGLSDMRIVSRHVFVIVRGPILIQTALVAGLAIGLQAGLEFIGIGSGSTPTWGAMLNEAFQNVQRAPLLMLWPGLALGVTTGALVLLATAVRDVLEDRGAEPLTGRTARRLARATSATSESEGTRATLLSVRGLSVAYALTDGSDREVVHDIGFDIERGEIVGLVGESGSGKSQTAFSVLGILPLGGRVSSGSITIDRRETVGMDKSARRDIAGNVTGYVPQEPMSNLDPTYTIGSQLTEPMRVKLGIGRRDARERALELLRQVEIAQPEHVYNSYPHEVSGGMAQRVLIAGAMACDPDLLIADEPTTALDVTVQAEILEILRGLRDRRGLGVLLVTHNLGVVADVCDRVLVMNEGRIVESGSTEDILRSPQHPYTQRLLAAGLEDVPLRASVGNTAPMVKED